MREYPPPSGAATLLLNDKLGREAGREYHLEKASNYTRTMLDPIVESPRPGPNHELTTATASISIMKSGPARRVTPTVVLVGVATPK